MFLFYFYRDWVILQSFEDYNEIPTPASVQVDEEYDADSFGENEEKTLERLAERLNKTIEKLLCKASQSHCF